MTLALSARPISVTVRAIGSVAAPALRACDGRLDPIEGFAESPYRRAGGVVVWLGTRPRVLHPRMVVVEQAPPPGQSIAAKVGVLAAPWHPSLPTTLDAARFRQRVSALVARLATIAPARGFGMLFTGDPLPFPLELALPRLQTLVAAVAGNDDEAIAAAATRLLGFGTGLTPSGDDLVGGMLFARRLLDQHTSRRSALAERLVAAAGERTHAISAALFADLADGASYAWLHDLVAALAGHASETETADALRALVGVGHSSGWDMLAGFVLGATGRLPNLARTIQ